MTYFEQLDGYKISIRRNLYKEICFGVSDQEYIEQEFFKGIRIKQENKTVILLYLTNYIIRCYIGNIFFFV